MHQKWPLDYMSCTAHDSLFHSDGRWWFANDKRILKSHISICFGWVVFKLLSRRIYLKLNSIIVKWGITRFQRQPMPKNGESNELRLYISNIGCYIHMEDKTVHLCVCTIILFNVVYSHSRRRHGGIQCTKRKHYMVAMRISNCAAYISVHIIYNIYVYACDAF